MFIGFLLLMTLALFIYSAALLLERRSLIESIVVGSSVFFACHIIMSYLFFLFDAYTPVNNALAVLGVGLFVTGILILRNRSIKPEVSTDLKGFIVPLIIILVLLPFTVVKNQYYGLGQDEGGYQTQAIMFMNGDTNKVHKFYEYYTIPEAYRSEFMADISDLTGMDSAGDLLERPERYVHGIPTYAAILTSWGSVFGYKNMLGVMSVLYVLSVMMVYLCSRNLRMDKISRYLAMFVFGFVPAVIWVSKSALTEGVTALMILLFIYLVTNGRNRLWALLPIVAFGCFHMSFFSMLPMFIGVYGIFYFFSRDRKDILSMALIPPLGIISYLTMVQIQPTYTIENYKKLFRKLLGSDVPDLDLAVIIVLLIYVILIVLFIFILRFSKKISLEKVRNHKYFGMILRILSVLPILLVIYNFFSSGVPSKRELLESAQSSSLWLFIVGAGLLTSVMAAAMFMFKPGKIFESESSAALAVMFFYGVLIYSAVINKEITALYYNSRYLVPYTAIAVLFVMFMLKDVKKAVVLPSAIISMCIFVPVNINLLENYDDTMMEWNTIDDIVSMISSEDRVIVMDSLERQMWIPVKQLTGASVYPVFVDNLYAEAEGMAAGYGNVYIISDRPIYEDESMRELSLVYHDTYKCVGDDHPSVCPLTLYPWKFDEFEDEIYVYKYTHQDVKEYPILRNYQYYEGLTGYEHDYSWTGEDEVILNCTLYKDNYFMTVELNDLIPFGFIANGSVNVEINANGNYVGTATISADENRTGFVAYISAEYLVDGENKISFKSDTWPAALNNPEDDRQLGIAIKNVIFESEVKNQ